jgi:hypothetical protein
VRRGPPYIRQAAIHAVLLLGHINQAGATERRKVEGRDWHLSPSRTRLPPEGEDRHRMDAEDGADSPCPSQLARMDGLYSSHSGPAADGQHMQTPNDDDVEYDSHVNQITIPSYASSPTSPQTPFSPRAMAIQQLKRAASVREAAGRREEQQPHQQHLQLSASDHGHSQASLSPAASSLASPGIGMSPSMSRAPSIKRLGLERSASDAARRMAMAKLTGEKVTACVDNTFYSLHANLGGLNDLFPLPP